MSRLDGLLSIRRNRPSHNGFPPDAPGRRYGGPGARLPVRLSLGSASRARRAAPTVVTAWTPPGRQSVTLASQVRYTVANGSASAATAVYTSSAAARAPATTSFE